MASPGVNPEARDDGARLNQRDSGLVLLVDDEPLLLRSLQRILQAAGHRIRTAESAQAAASALADPDLDVVLLDLFLGRASGFELLERWKRERPEVEVIVMTGHASIESAVRCIRRGAFDYLAKPFDDVHRVRTTVGKAIERRRLVRRNRQLEEELKVRSTAPELVGNAPKMRALARTIHSLRRNESHVLITGESGTGKELVARAVHAASPRADGELVPVDCGALPETIIIGEVPPGVQAKLLRALQHKEVRPVGASFTVPVDLRVVAATHRNLADLVAEGRFRADLFYRLNVVRIEVPPLRDRREDIPLLVHHFLDMHGSRAPVDGIEDEALALLVASDWPGNVRELENAMESALALAPGPKLRVADLRVARRGPAPAGSAALDEVALSLEAYECSALERALRENGGDAKAAARSLGIGRSTFYRKLAKHDSLRRGDRTRSIG
jgi:DNA-binding NtrC family response regulator